MRHLALMLLMLLTGCDSGLDLVVELRTDLVPGRDFTQVVTFVDGNQVASVDAPSGDLVAGVQVAEVSGLTPTDARRVRVALEGGPAVADRFIIASHRSALVVTAVIASSCAGVTCAEGLTCVAGDCVDARCLTGAEPECPPPQCTDAASCAPRSACAVPSCADGVCLYARGACDATERCDLDLGCQPIEQLDAGAPIDAGSTVDGGLLTCMDCNSCAACASDCCQRCEETLRCDHTCSAGATCSFTSEATSDASVSCEAGSSCTVVIEAVASARVVCSGDAQCDVDCADATCVVDCEGESVCLLRCESGACSMPTCEEGATMCPGNVTVCNRACP